tara:strand:- start:11801 stop:12331 length:531 start_codon:yes stop_codon:yes gene_type:complete
MPRRQKRYNPNIPWGLYFSENDTGMPSGWTNVTLDLTTLEDGVANISDQYDILSRQGLVSEWWRWRARFAFTAGTVVGELMRLYICGADDTDAAVIDGDFGASAAAGITVADLANCDNFGNVDTTQQTECIQSGLVRIMDRYISLAVHNDTADEHTTATAGDSWVKMWPVPPIETP